MNQDHPDPLHRIADVARLLSVSRWTVRRWIADGTLEAVDLNPRPTGRAYYRVRQSTLDDLLSRLTLAKPARRPGFANPNARPKGTDPNESDGNPKTKTRSKPQRLAATRRHYV